MTAKGDSRIRKVFFFAINDFCIVVAIFHVHVDKYGFAGLARRGVH